MKRRNRSTRRLLWLSFALLIAGGIYAWQKLGNSIAPTTSPSPSDMQEESRPAVATRRDEPISTTLPSDAEAKVPPIALTQAPASLPLPASAPDSRTSEPTPLAPATLPSTLPWSPTRAPASQPTSRPATMPSAQAMSQALGCLNSGELVQARSLINMALLNHDLSAADELTARKMAAEINRTLVFSPRRVPGDQWIDQYTVQPGDALRKIAPRYELTWQFVARINRIADPTKLRYNVTLKLLKGPFHAIVTKHRFTMDMYLGSPGGDNSMYVCTFPVGLGQDDSTPTGTWLIEPGKKLQNPKYYDPHGGATIDADDPKNPLGEYWLGLTGTEGEALGKRSYGIHGTIDPDSIGKQASQGCIRLGSADIELVYEMLLEGKSTVIVRP